MGMILGDRKWTGTLYRYLDSRSDPVVAAQIAAAEANVFHKVWLCRQIYIICHKTYCMQAVKPTLQDNRVWVDGRVTRAMQYAADIEVADTIRRSLKNHEAAAKRAVVGTVKSYFIF